MSDVVNLNKVTKFFIDDSQNSRSIKERLSSFFTRRTSEPNDSRKYTVLDQVSIQIKKGEFLGIMGRNGAGKSTILKVIAGIYAPNEGTVQTRGRIIPLLELGAGFVEELSGFENIILNAAIMGFSRAEAMNTVDKIIDFSELGNKIHMAVRTYSSGMMVRLGFSIAAHLEADVLLFDEILAVGDAGFQHKCLEKVKSLYANGKTIVLVTHTPELIADYCDRCILIDRAKIIFDGDAHLGAKKYVQLFSS